MIERLIRRIARCLDKNKIPYMIIGGQAVLLYAEPRLTRDIDITLGLDTDKFPVVRKACGELGLKMLSPDPENFAKETKVLPAEERRLKIRVDFIFSFTPYERQAIRRARKVSIGGYPVKFASCEDVIIHKMFAARAIDEEDVKNILLKNRGKVNLPYIKRWLLKFSKIAGGKELLNKFNRLLKNRKQRTLTKKLAVSLILFFLPLSAFAQEETLTFTTYYPAPYGNYHEFRTQHLAVGNTYVTKPEVCWENCPPSAILIPGITPISDNTHLVVEDNVGIGTRTASARLTVQGSSTTSATSSLNVTDSSGSSNLFVRDDGYVGIRTVTPQPHPKGQPGNLDVNDVYFRSTGTWFSQTILTADYTISGTETIPALTHGISYQVTVIGAEVGDVALIALTTTVLQPSTAVVTKKDTVEFKFWNYGDSATVTIAQDELLTIKVIKQ